MPFQFARPARSAVAAAIERRHKVRGHAVHQRLGFGIAQANVELEDLGAGIGHHQAGVQEAGEPVRFDGGIDHAVEDYRVCASVRMAAVAVRAHAAGVGAGIAIEDGLVILGGGEGDDVAAVAQRDEADFFAAQKLFDHQAAVSVASAASASARSCAMMTPLPAARPSALSTTGKPKRSSARRASAGLSTATKSAVGILLCTKKFFAKILLPSSCAASRVRPDDLPAARAELIHHSGDQRRFRSDHRQIGADVFGQRQVSGGPAGRQVADLGDARIAGRREHFRLQATAPASSQRVFAAAAAEDQDSHFGYNHNNAREVRRRRRRRGHAGCEAARACARMGLRTAMVTMNLDLIAQMSCNPAIGGIAKGHLVREIDALGGVMGEVADAVGIQFRLLNTSRGPAVWSPRAQMDKKMYRVRMREVLEKEPNLRIKQAEVASLCDWTAVASPACTCAMAGTIDAGAVIVTTGTFLNGLAHVGETTVQLRAQWRGAVATAGRSTAHARASVDAPEDRDAAAAGRAHDRLVAVRTAAGGCRADAVFVPDREDRPAADPVPHRLHHRGDASHSARGHSAVAAL